MDGLISSGSNRTYDDFKKQIPSLVQPLFDSLREFCFSLGENVVEDVRMHRIVFGKSMTFRWFADIEPQNDGIIVKTQKNRKEPPLIINIKLNQETSQLKETIKDAFQTIH